jgi:hypothetical protein
MFNFFGVSSAIIEFLQAYVALTVQDRCFSKGEPKNNYRENDHPNRKPNGVCINWYIFRESTRKYSQPNESNGKHTQNYMCHIVVHCVSLFCLHPGFRRQPNSIFDNFSIAAISQFLVPLGCVGAICSRALTPPKKIAGFEKPARTFVLVFKYNP